MVSQMENISSFSLYEPEFNAWKMARKCIRVFGDSSGKIVATDSENSCLSFAASCSPRSSLYSVFGASLSNSILFRNQKKKR